MAGMIDHQKQILSSSLPRLTRRGLLARAGLAAAPAMMGGSAAAQGTPKALAIGPRIYESIGVTPMIKCRGTLTAIGGSVVLVAVPAMV